MLSFSVSLASVTKNGAAIRAVIAVDFVTVSNRLLRLCRLRGPDGRFDLRHISPVGFDVLEQMPVQIKRQVDRGMPHDGLQPFRRPAKIGECHGVL